jgi:DNA repair protein RAD50
LEAIKSLRKDRVSELKADKERLESLSREKAHADKLKNRIADLRSTIANKELEYEEAKKQYEALVVANQLFYDRATKFRDIYMKLETLQEQKTRYVSELEEARGVVQELEGMLDSVFVPSVF